MAATGKPFLDNSPTSVFYQAVNQVSQKYYDDAGNPVYADNPEVKQSFDLALRAIDADISAKLSYASEGWNAALPRGDYAVVSAPSWMLNSFRRIAPDTAVRCVNPDCRNCMMVSADTAEVSPSTRAGSIAA